MSRLDRLSKVLVFGATGAQGSPVVRQLLARGVAVRAVTRDAQKLNNLFGVAAEPAEADLGNATALRAAFEGVDAAFFHLPIPRDIEAVPVHLANVLEAAAKAELSRLVYTTSGITTETMPPIGFVEASRAAAAAVLTSGIPAVVLRPTIYLENLLQPHLVSEMAQAGVLRYPPVSPGRRLSWTALEDQAALAIAAMTADETVIGRAFDIASPEALTGDELAARLSVHFAREVRFEPQTPLQFGEDLGRAFGNPTVGRAIAELYEAIDKLPPDGAVLQPDTVLSANAPELTPVSQWLSRQGWGSVLAR